MKEKINELLLSSLNALDWYKILELMKGNLAGEIGKTKLFSLIPSFHTEEVLQRQKEMKRWFSLFEKGEEIRLSSPAVEHLPVIEHFLSHRALDEKMLHSLFLVMKEALFLRNRMLALQAENDTLLQEKEWEKVKKWHFEVKQVLGETSGISDTASPVLKEIRHKKHLLEENIRLFLSRWMEKNREEMQEFLCTLRSGRYVVPVRMDRFDPHKYIVHDISTTGRTYFSEPYELVKWNNERQELTAREREEEERILREIGETFWNEREIWRKIQEFLENVSVFRAFYEFSREFSCHFPRIVPNPQWNLIGMRHPLLGEKAVPISLRLPEEKPALILSGPNSGGKTVSLKTVGVCVVMGCCGLPIPAEEGSEIFVPSLLFAQVGDEQSIERDWSAFTARLYRLKEALLSLEQAGGEDKKRAIFLLDEPSAGTHPEEGAIFAEAVLSFLVHHQAKVLLTTHSSLLKSTHNRIDGVEHASMGFDPLTLHPTYQIQMGIPGPSLAFPLIKRMGFPEEISVYLEKANPTLYMEEVLHSLHRLREQYRLLEEQWRRKNEELEREKQQWERQKEEEHQKWTQKIHQELEKVRIVLTEVKRWMAEGKKHPEGSAEFSTRVKENVESLQEWVYQKLKAYARPVPFKEVFIPALQQKATVFAEEPGGYVWVKLGEKEFRLSKATLQMEESIKGEEGKKPVHPVLDVRGMRWDKAVQEVDRWLNHSFLAGRTSGKILHGIGKGVLKKEIRQFLSTHPLVKKVRSGEISEGGEAVTYVELVESQE
ncbi:MAG: endonuclease MutS2 [bacterium JZ-2024 1]